MGLSNSLFALAATTMDHVLPKSLDLASTTSVRPFCSQEAYIVRRSRGSTTICASNCPDGEGRSSRGACQLAPLSTLTSSIMLGWEQPGQPGTSPYCGYSI